MQESDLNGERALETGVSAGGCEIRGAGEVVSGMGVRRDCMRSQIRGELLRRIVNGTYRPGDRLIELQVAREFNTSQAPVREAFRELEALRLVECQSYRGTRVRAISIKEMREAGAVRGLLEEEAARRAVGSFQGNTVVLVEILERIRNAAYANNLAGYAHENLLFHRQIVESSGNEVLLRVWESLMLESRVLIGLTARPRDLNALAETHVPIIDAFDRGEGECAGRLLRVHAEMFLYECSDPLNPHKNGTGGESPPDPPGVDCGQQI